jgi:ribosomal protein L35
MPKQKTRKSLIKRLRITKNGKIMRRQSFNRHLKANKSNKQLRSLKRVKQLKGFYAKKTHKATGTVKRTLKTGKSTINKK